MNAFIFYSFPPLFQEARNCELLNRKKSIKKERYRVLETGDPT
jgi:hypothetical protein